MRRVFQQALQYLKEMMALNLRNIMVGCYNFYMKWTPTIYRRNKKG